MSSLTRMMDPQERNRMPSRGPPYAHREWRFPKLIAPSQSNVIINDQIRITIDDLDMHHRRYPAATNHIALLTHTDSQDHLHSTFPVYHLFRILRPPHVNSGLVRKTMIHFVQRDCIKLQKVHGGISNGCRNMATNPIIHLHDSRLGPI